MPNAILQPKIKSRPLPFLVCAFSLIFLPVEVVHAATTNTTMAVTATVQSTCSVAATPLAFGTYSPLSGSALDSTATVTVTCTSGTSFNVGLNAGTASGATVSTRKMVQGANTLNYDLYTDSGRSTNWGNTSGVDTSAQQVASASASVLTIYGRIPSLQNVPAGAYADTVTVTVNY